MKNSEDSDIETPNKELKKKKKARKIKDVIKLVISWEKLKKGIKNKKGELVKFTPLEASEILGVSYKTLYDYSFFLK